MLLHTLYVYVGGGIYRWVCACVYVYDMHVYVKFMSEGLPFPHLLK